MASGPQLYLRAITSLQKPDFYPIKIKSWRAPELVRVPLAREESRRVNNNLMHAERVELVEFKQA